jgi:hypothetical protein
MNLKWAIAVSIGVVAHPTGSGVSSQRAIKLRAERQLHLPKDDNYVAPLSGATVTRR